jgi:hypothetical protein
MTMIIADWAMVERRSAAFVVARGQVPAGTIGRDDASFAAGLHLVVAGTGQERCWPITAAGRPGRHGGLDPSQVLFAGVRLAGGQPDAVRVPRPPTGRTTLLLLRRKPCASTVLTLPN